jgi:putative ABC transport system permease protein
MRRFRSALIAAEVAISLALLLTAGLLGRSALHQQQLDLGFEPGNLLTSTVLLRQQTYPDHEARAAFLERVVEELEASPGVVSATVVTPVPLGAGRPPSLVQSEGSSATSGLEATVFRMLPDAFSDLGIPLLLGRAFETTDRPETEAVAVVSETLANRLWPGMNPTGQRIRMAPAGVGAEPGPWIRVVGVAGDVRAQLRAEDTPDLYLPVHQAALATNGVVIRTRAPAMSGADVLRSVLRTLDPDLAAARVRPFDQLTADALAQGRFLATFIAGFATVAMAVSMFGLYAVIAYAVQQRRREVAIRLTLGATPPEVARLFIAKAWLTVLSGLAAGALLALPIIRLLRDQLQGLDTSDPATWALVTGAVMCCALLAVWLPARGAGRTQPAEVLRGD